MRTRCAEKAGGVPRHQWAACFRVCQGSEASQHQTLRGPAMPTLAAGGLVAMFQDLREGLQKENLAVSVP
uniref:ADAM metallopeptidase with thrombospondin type 1 motif, 1 n=1 Tax=Sus scrofa TaxID=9823 RepID=D0G0B5_PIG|nr:ADAM metallopeptidase with thrombospondin type 1 motif, 1 [Sus scrofa]